MSIFSFLTNLCAMVSYLVLFYLMFTTYTTLILGRDIIKLS